VKSGASVAKIDTSGGGVKPSSAAAGWFSQFFVGCSFFVVY